MHQHALVLLGCRGSGKDTLARELQQQALDPALVYNCKFSALTKALVASAFGVPLADLEDKRLRTTPVNPDYMGDLTTLDLLDSLFLALSVDHPSTNRLKRANVIYCLGRARASQASLVVFTDVRRLSEAAEVVQAFPSHTFVYLSKHDAHESTSDRYIRDIAVEYSASTLRIRAKDTPDLTYKKLIGLLYET